MALSAALRFIRGSKEARRTQRRDDRGRTTLDYRLQIADPIQGLGSKVKGLSLLRDLPVLGSFETWCSLCLGVQFRRSRIKQRAEIRDLKSESLETGFELPVSVLFLLSSLWCLISGFSG